MKVIQKKNIANQFFPGEEVDYLTLSRLNKAITDFYLPRWNVSPLKSLLLKRLCTLKNLYLYLNVTCELDGQTVSSLRLCFDLLNDWEREDERLGRITLNNKVIDECLFDYFKSIGYDKTYVSQRRILPVSCVAWPKTFPLPLSILHLVTLK